MDKGGDLTSAQIIAIVLAIAGFLVVLFFLFASDIFGSGQSQREICHVSVITRATTPAVGQSLVPLKCKTEKICLTLDSSSKCEAQFGKDKDVEVIVLRGSVQEMRTKIEEVSANAMYDCWDMMGQGKLDLFGSVKRDLGFDVVSSTCVICSRVAVDKSVINGGRKIVYDNKETPNDSSDDEGIDINNYMKTHQIPGKSLTYLQAFTDRGVSSFASVKQDGLSKLPKADESKINLQGTSNNEMAIVFMQIKPESMGDVLGKLAAAGATVAGATFVSPVGRIVGSVIFTGWGFIATAVGAAAVGGYGAYNAYQGQLAAAGYCGEFTSHEQAKNSGCSLVQGINYNVADVNKLCGTIEGEI